MYSCCKETLLKVPINCNEIMKLLMYYDSVMNIFHILKKKFTENASKLFRNNYIILFVMTVLLIYISSDCVLLHTNIPLHSDCWLH
jgi:hypothetical protein